MTNLSPAAQAVLDAYSKHVSEWLKSSKTDKPSSHYHASGMAAALRAAVAVTQQYQGNDCLSDEIWTCDADELLAIADELEGQ
jgi:hypothetical protein